MAGSSGDTNNMQEFFVTLGRIEGKLDSQGATQENILSSVVGLDTRLRIVENVQVQHAVEIEATKSQKSRKATWPMIVGAVGTLVGIVVVLSGFFMWLSKITELVAP